MKKLMTALAVCAIASLSLADSGVVSANIVGYQNVAVKTGRNLLALNWNNVGGGGVDIQSLLDKSSLTKGDGFSADVLQLFDNTSKTWTSYFLYSSTGSPALDNKWVEVGQTTPATLTVNPGMGFWLDRKSHPQTNVIVKGEVNQSATAVYPFTTGRNLFGNKFAAAIGLNDQPWTNGKKGDGFSADVIQVFDNTSKAYTSYFLYSSTGSPALDNKWVEVGQTTPTAAKIDLGRGAWYYRAAGGSGSVAITKPY